MCIRDRVTIWRECCLHLLTVHFGSDWQANENLHFLKNCVDKQNSEENIHNTEDTDKCEQQEENEDLKI